MTFGVARALYCASMSTGPSPSEQYPEILTTAQASQLLAVHVEYLRKMVREGRIPAHRFPGGREIRFLRDELIAWVAQQPGHDRSPSAGKPETSDDAAPKRAKKSASGNA
jgi:excisionase family DNA binding protein